MAPGRCDCNHAKPAGLHGVACRGLVCFHSSAHHAADNKHQTTEMRKRMRFARLLAFMAGTLLGVGAVAAQDTILTCR
jgi:hypothetical protein